MCINLRNQPKKNTNHGHKYGHIKSHNNSKRAYYEDLWELVIIGNNKLIILHERGSKWPKFAENGDFWPFSGSKMTEMGTNECNLMEVCLKTI